VVPGRWFCFFTTQCGFSPSARRRREELDVASLKTVGGQLGGELLLDDRLVNLVQQLPANSFSPGGAFCEVPLRGLGACSTLHGDDEVGRLNKFLPDFICPFSVPDGDLTCRNRLERNANAFPGFHCGSRCRGRCCGCDDRGGCHGGHGGDRRSRRNRWDHGGGRRGRLPIVIGRPDGADDDEDDDCDPHPETGEELRGGDEFSFHGGGVFLLRLICIRKADRAQKPLFSATFMQTKPTFSMKPRNPF